MEAQEEKGKAKKSKRKQDKFLEWHSTGVIQNGNKLLASYPRDHTGIITDLSCWRQWMVRGLTEFTTST